MKQPTQEGQYPNFFGSAARTCLAEVEGSGFEKTRVSGFSEVWGVNMAQFRA